MAKTMRNVVITAILLIVVAGAACWMVLTGGCTAAFDFLGSSNPFTSAQVATTNALIDASGVKDRVESELHSQADRIASEYGVPVGLLNAGIEDLAIQEWEAVEKPENAVETGSYSVDAGGTQIGITTYDDASIIGVEAYGIDATLGVPESAQPYMSLVPLLGYQDQIGALTEGDYMQLLQLLQE